jgi:ribosome-binding factor A
MRPFSRSDRVGGLIKQVLAELLLKQISDPRLADATITGVQVSRDLRLAKIYFCTPGGEIRARMPWTDSSAQGALSSANLLNASLCDICRTFVFIMMARLTMAPASNSC